MPESRPALPEPFPTEQENLSWESSASMMPLTKLAAGLVKGDLGQMKKLLDPSEVGGTPFLGIQKPVIKAHGGSNARAIENAVLRAKEYAESGFIADIQANIEHMRVQPGMEKN